jgi:hypothetical protein
MVAPIQTPHHFARWLGCWCHIIVVSVPAPVSSRIGQPLHQALRVLPCVIALSGPVAAPSCFLSPYRAQTSCSPPTCAACLKSPERGNRSRSSW